MYEREDCVWEGVRVWMREGVCVCMRKSVCERKKRKGRVNCDDDSLNDFNQMLDFWHQWWKPNYSDAITHTHAHTSTNAFYCPLSSLLITGSLQQLSLLPFILLTLFIHKHVSWPLQSFIPLTLLSSSPQVSYSPPPLLLRPSHRLCGRQGAVAADQR